MTNLTGPWDGPVGPDVPVPTLGGRALALSGGGFRATLFQLGVVARMYELGALDGITYLTSVSGGSILAGVLALSWQRLMDPVVADRAALFEQLIGEPIQRVAQIDLRDRAVRRAMLVPPWRRPVECMAELLDENLYQGRTFGDLPPVDVLRVGFNSCNLDDGKRFVFTQDYFGDITGGYTTTACGALPLATAVSASAAFPVGLAPFPVSLRGPYKQWVDGKFVPSNHPPPDPIPFGDGGIYENLALQAARARCTEVVVVNGGEAVDVSVAFTDGNPITTVLRSVGIMMGRGARNVISDAIRDESYGMFSGVIVENTQNASNVATQILPVRSIGQQPQPAPTFPIDNTRFPPLSGANGYPRDVATMLATLRTDLDAFSDLEISASRVAKDKN